MSKIVNNKIVKMEGVCYECGGNKILKDVNFSVGEGEFVSLVGASGIGKTTLLKMVLGSLCPTCGTVLVDGKNKKSPDCDCDIVFQRFSLFPHMKVIDNIIFGLKNKQKSYGQFDNKKNEDELFRRRAYEFITKFYLGDIADKYPFQLSIGMQQRVAIAQALITKPKILLLDEPFSALDPWVRSELHIFLLELFKETKMTMILVTHDLEEAIYLSSKVAIVGKQKWGDIEAASILGEIKVNEPYPRSIEFKTSARLNMILAKLYKCVDSSLDNKLVSKNSEIISLLNLLSNNQDLYFANSLIGEVILSMGRKLNNTELRKWGKWIVVNNEKSQREIDQKVVEIFSNFIHDKNSKIAEILSKLDVGQTQHMADRLIVELFIEVDNLRNIF